MELDKNYTYIQVCPQTGERLTPSEIDYCNGVCPRCGHNNGASVHAKKKVGRWKNPSSLEWLMGKRKEFFPNDEEDEIMRKLKGEFKGQQEGPVPNDEPTSRDYVNQQLNDIRKLIDGSDSDKN